MGFRSRATRAPSGNRPGKTLPRSAQPSTPRNSAASSPAVVTTGRRRTSAPAYSPSTASARYARPRFRYDHDRSGAIDQRIVSPFQSTKAANSPSAHQPCFVGAGRGRNPASVANIETKCRQRGNDPDPEQAPVARPVTEEERHHQQRARDAEDRKPCGRSHRSKLAQAQVGIGDGPDSLFTDT